METLIFIALGIMALTILFMRSRKTLKRFSENYEDNHCTGCSNCCSSAGNPKEERVCRI